MTVKKKFNYLMFIMQLLKDKIRKKMAEKHLGKNVIGAVSINIIKRYIESELDVKNIEDILGGYVRFNKVFVKTNDQKIKIFMYKKKQEILGKANESLANL
jgi:PIN domain nuclease of toxin-antitoxin system